MNLKNVRGREVAFCWDKKQIIIRLLPLCQHILLEFCWLCHEQLFVKSFIYFNHPVSSCLIRERFCLV